MFVRFRQNAHRLQVSLVETGRVNGKVRHEHIASLGSIITPLTVASRIAFWAKLHERLARLSNRIDGEAQGKILGRVHERIPMVTPDEQRSLQLENAKLDAEQWSSIHRLNAGMADDHQGLAAKVASTISHAEREAEQAAAHAKEAQERVERIERGENVEGGLQDPLTREDMEAIMLKAGMTRADIDHCRQVAELLRVARSVAGDDGEEVILCKISDAGLDASERAVRAAVRRMMGNLCDLIEDECSGTE
jgi:hypothetical protein